jgi:Lrp/AsnC family transcriptional regulator, leucine-responsive regulatory protein
LIPSVPMVNRCLGFSRYYITCDLPNVESINVVTNEYLGKIQGINHIETMIVLSELKLTYYFDRGSNMPNVKLGYPEDIGISKIDHRLIIELQKNARASLKELAHAVGMSKMTVLQHIRTMVRSKVIELTAIPNVTELGYPEIAYIRIESKPNLTNQIAEYCTKFPQIITISTITGPTNLLIVMRGSSYKEIADFLTGELSKINGIIKIESFEFIRILKTNFTWLSD